MSSDPFPVKPLSKREWDEITELEQPEGYRKINRDDLLRIKATINQGWAPEEPSNEELNEWAAKHVMGWARSEWAVTWVDGDGVHVRHEATWTPAADIAQALQVAMETKHCVIVASEEEHRDGRLIKQAHATVDLKEVHRGAFDEAAIARSIMLALHECLEARA